MSDDAQIDKDEVKNDSNQASIYQKKPDYAKWVGIVATFLSIFLAFLTYRLDAERRNTETQLEKFKKHQDELSANLEEIRGRIEIDYNFYSEGAVTFLQKSQANKNSNKLLSNNEVYNQIVKQMRRQRWDKYYNLMRCVYGYFPKDPNIGMLGTRQIVYFEIFYNPSPDSKKLPADKVEITYRVKDFPPIPENSSLFFKSSFTDLAKDDKNWQTKALKVEQLKAGNKITIPIAHMVGPIYSESLVIPIKISWYNPLLKRNEEKSLDFESMMSELDGKYNSFLVGNFKRSCQ